MTHYEVHHVDYFRGDISFKGVPYADFDRTGHWSLWNICRMYEGARMMMLTRNLFYYKKLVNRENAFYVVKQTMQVEPDVHRNVTLFSPCSLRFKLEMLHIGNTSLSFVTNLYNQETNTYMGRVYITLVYVKRKTGRPAPFPEWVQEEFAQYKNKAVPVYHKIPACPEKVFQTKTEARYSDTDVNGHVNQANYLQICLDCATDAALSRFYKHFADDMCWFPVVEVKVVYKGECRPGEELDITTWQDTDNFCVIYFIVKKESKNIYEARFLFDEHKSQSQRNSKV